MHAYERQDIRHSLPSRVEIESPVKWDGDKYVYPDLERIGEPVDGRNSFSLAADPYIHEYDGWGERYAEYGTDVSGVSVVVDAENARRFENSISVVRFLSVNDVSKMNLHFFGDVTPYHMHWIERTFASSYMRANFDVEIDTPHIDGSIFKYVCTKDFFGRKMPRHKKPDGWDLVRSRRPVITDTDAELDDDRIFCLGCALEKKRAQRFMMTAIDVDSDSIVLFDMSLDMAIHIKALFAKSNDGRYENIGQWLYDHDIVVGCSQEPKFVKVFGEERLSKYINISGEAIIPNASFLIAQMTVENARSFNKYGDPYRQTLRRHQRRRGAQRTFENQTLKNRYIKRRDSFSQVLQCNFDLKSKEVTYYDPAKKSITKTIKLKKDQGEEKVTPSRYGFLEL